MSSLLTVVPAFPLPFQNKRDQNAREILVFVFEASPKSGAGSFFRLLTESPPMITLHQATVPPTVLVVEDEMLLRMRAVDMIEDAGFSSVEAVDADEALAILESRSDISLLFTDIQMPGTIDGLKLAHAVRERWPPIKIILVSGQLKPSSSDIPINSRFFDKSLEADQMIAEIKGMIAHS